MTRHRSFLAFDYGERRVGVACGGSLLRRAQPLRTVDAVGAARFDAIARLVDEWRPDALVVGVPFHPDGAEHENTLRARRFARRLHGRLRLPVHEVDERWTTTEALADAAAQASAGRRLAGAERDPDARAAALILEQFLRTLPESDPPIPPTDDADDERQRPADRGA